MNCFLFSFSKDNPLLHYESRYVAKSNRNEANAMIAFPYEKEQNNESDYKMSHIVYAQYLNCIHQIRYTLMMECYKRNIFNEAFLKIIEDELAGIAYGDSLKLLNQICSDPNQDLESSSIQEGFTFEIDAPVRYFVAAAPPCLANAWKNTISGKDIIEKILKRAYARFFSSQVKYFGPDCLDDKVLNEMIAKNIPNHYPDDKEYFWRYEHLFSNKRVECFTLILEHMRNYIINRLEDDENDLLLPGTAATKKFHLCRLMISRHFLAREFSHPTTTLTRKLHAGCIKWAQRRKDFLVEQFANFYGINQSLKFSEEEVCKQIRCEELELMRYFEQFTFTEDDGVADGDHKHSTQSSYTNRNKAELKPYSPNDYPPIIPNGMDVPYSIQEAPAFNIPKK